jgi:hypothetical protein
MVVRKRQRTPYIQMPFPSEIPLQGRGSARRTVVQGEVNPYVKRPKRPLLGDNGPPALRDTPQTVLQSAS